MELTKDCKVLFTTLIQRMWKTDEEVNQIDKPLFLIDPLIAYTIKLAKKNRFMDLKENKFCFLESAIITRSNDAPTIITGLFKSARNEFRPNLINRRTGGERINPKLLVEGDIEKTHFVIKIDKRNNEVYMFLEHNYHGVNPNNVVNYFKKFHYLYLAKNGHKRDSSIIHFIIPRNDFMNELEKITRSRLAEVYFEKRLLGSNALEFSERTVSLKNELKLVASASPRESITEFIVDCYNKFRERRNSITKVRVYGVDEDKNEVILDTSFMSKVEFVTVDLDQNTGEVNTVQLHTGLKRIANNL